MKSRVAFANKQRSLRSTRKKQASHASSMHIGPNLMTEEGTGIVVGLPGFQIWPSHPRQGPLKQQRYRQIWVIPLHVRSLMVIVVTNNQINHLWCRVALGRHHIQPEQVQNLGFLTHFLLCMSHPLSSYAPPVRI